MTVGDRLVKADTVTAPPAAAGRGLPAPGGYVREDSALLRAAEDLLGSHTGEPGGLCARCEQLVPCAAARHAEEVLRAAGRPGPVRSIA